MLNPLFVPQAGASIDSAAASSSSSSSASFASSAAASSSASSASSDLTSLTATGPTQADRARLHNAQIEREKELQSFLLAQTEIERKAQIDRINIALKLNPLDVMDLPLDAGAAEVQKKFKELSLQVS